MGCAQFVGFKAAALPAAPRAAKVRAPQRRRRRSLSRRQLHASRRTATVVDRSSHRASHQPAAYPKGNVDSGRVKEGGKLFLRPSR